jgi:alkaline phosphatase
LDTAPKRGTTFQQAAIHTLNLLKSNKKGFFALLEGSRIDDMGHMNNLPGVVEEVLDFDQTIGKVLQWAANDGETLVIITADHETGGLTLLDGNKETGYVTGKFSTGGHSGVMVPVYAWGPGAADFSGIYENTELFRKIQSLLRLR